MTFPRVLLITDRSLASEAQTVETAVFVVEVLERSLAETVAFAVRDHELPVGDRLRLARALDQTVLQFGVRVLVHDRVDVALLLAADGVDGVMLGRRSLSLADARVAIERTSVHLSRPMSLGVACHDEHELARAAEAGADFATLSPLFASPGKGEALGLERFAQIRATCPSLPVLALGGIDGLNAHEAIDAGADGVAAIRAWLCGAQHAGHVEEMAKAAQRGVNRPRR